MNDNPAVVAWCAYSSVSHSVDSASMYTVDRIPLGMMNQSTEILNNLSQFQLQVPGP